MKVFFKIRVTQAGTADSAMDLLIMSAMIGAIVPGSFFIIHVGTGSKPHVLFGDLKKKIIMSLGWTGLSKASDVMVLTAWHDWLSAANAARLSSSMQIFEILSWKNMPKESQRCFRESCVSRDVSWDECSSLSTIWNSAFWSSSFQNLQVLIHVRILSPAKAHAW